MKETFSAQGASQGSDGASGDDAVVVMKSAVKPGNGVEGKTERPEAGGAGEPARRKPEGGQ